MRSEVLETPHGRCVLVAFEDPTDETELARAIERLPLVEQGLAGVKLSSGTRRDFVAGRTALHLALDDFDVPIVRTHRGAPEMPDGLTGSVSHKTGTAIAIVAPAGAGWIGIDLELKVIEYALFVDARAKINYDTLMVVNPLPLTDPEGAGRYISRKLGGQFASGDDDKTLELIAQQSLATTTEERKKIVNDLQYRVAEVVPHVFVAWQNSFIGMWPQVKNYNFAGGVYSHNKFQDVWLAK